MARARRRHERVYYRSMHHITTTTLTSTRRVTKTKRNAYDMVTRNNERTHYMERRRVVRCSTRSYITKSPLRTVLVKGKTYVCARTQRPPYRYKRILEYCTYSDWPVSWNCKVSAHHAEQWEGTRRKVKDIILLRETFDESNLFTRITVRSYGLSKRGNSNGWSNACRRTSTKRWTQIKARDNVPAQSLALLGQWRTLIPFLLNVLVPIEQCQTKTIK